MYSRLQTLACMYDLLLVLGVGWDRQSLERQSVLLDGLHVDTTYASKITYPTLR